MPKKQMTNKQREFFKELLSSPSYAEAARRAGYSEKSCRVSAHRNITKYNGFFANLLDAAGVDIESLGKIINQGLNSENENVKFKYTKLMMNLIEKVLQSEELVDETESTQKDNKLTASQQAEIKEALKIKGIE